MTNHTVVYAADRTYQETLEAAIKSLTYHNDHLTIYVINNDIPQEWFSNLNRYLVDLDSSVIDKKINLADFQQLATPQAYLSYMAYGRLLIPQLITADQVLYLDCDTIVTGDLTPLFNTDLGDHYLAAVRDCVIDGFNSGVMLLNNRLLRQQPEKFASVFSAGQNTENAQADQSALNAIFGTEYQLLDDRYNYMVGSEADLFYQPENAGDYFERLANCQDPVIIHYTSANKPWLTTSGGRMRDLWWQYKDLEWHDIIYHTPLPRVWRKSRGQLFLFTQGQELLNFRKLTLALPEFDFYVGAWTGMGDHLLKLLEVPNIHLYPRISGPLLDQLSHDQVAYLDLAANKEDQATQKASDLDKPILTFSSTADQRDFNNYHVFADDDVMGMADYIRNLVNHEE